MDWIDKTTDPFELFNNWYKSNLENNSFEPTKVTLATLDDQGFPNARVVLLKEYDERGFCFFTNYDSDKSKQLMQNPKATLVFHWQNPIHQQVRIQGLVEKTSRDESSSYFSKRARGSQIGAWASPQSQEISSRQELMNLVAEVEAKFEGKDVPCPENWGGFRLKPLSMEFWQAGEYRLHDRARFSRENLESPWTKKRLAP